MKKLLAILITTSMLFAFVQIAAAADNPSPSNEPKLIGLIEDDIVIPTPDIPSYLELVTPKTADPDSRVTAVADTFSSTGNVATTFGNDITVLQVFGFKIVGNISFSTVKVSLYIPNMATTGNKLYMQNPDGTWVSFPIDSIDGKTLTATVPFADIYNVFTLVAPTAISPKTGVTNLLIFLIPAAVITLGVCTYSAKRYLAD